MIGKRQTDLLGLIESISCEAFAEAGQRKLLILWLSLDSRNAHSAY